MHVEASPPAIQAPAPVNLRGRVLVGARGASESECVLSYDRDGGIRIVSPSASAAEPGQEAVCYVEGVGRLAGTVAGKVAGKAGSGFVLAPSGSEAARRKVMSRLDWIVLNGADASEKRADARIVPHRTDVRVRSPGHGEAWDARIVDVSRSGMHVASRLRPDLGAMVFLGRRGARVVRHTEEGFAAQFALPVHAAGFDEGFVP